MLLLELRHAQSRKQIPCTRQAGSSGLLLSMTSNEFFSKLLGKDAARTLREIARENFKNGRMRRRAFPSIFGGTLPHDKRDLPW